MYIRQNIHAKLDYLISLILILVPWIPGIPGTASSTYVMTGFGLLFALVSLFSDYKAGIFKVISMQCHLAVDALAGLTLSLSPWIFAFSEDTLLPMFPGLVMAISGMLTELRSGRDGDASTN